MLDSEIVAAIVAGDPDGLAAAYDRYASPLYAFCQSLLDDQADAADVVQDTFIIARAKLDRLRDPELLQPWLFAVARNECHDRLRAWPGGVADGETGGVSDDTIDLGIDLERAAQTEVVGAAMAALPLAKREAIELSLHQDFDSDDLAIMLGVSPKQAQALTSHAAGQFEKSAAALLVARSGGRQHCEELDELLDSQDDRLSAAACQEIVRHVHHCRTCAKRRPRDLQPATLLSVLPATEIARGLRRQVLSVVASDAPDVVAYRANVVWAVRPFDEASGFPVPVDRPERERRVRPAVLALGATAVVAALCAVGLELGLHHPHRQQLAAASAGGQPVLSPEAQAASSSSQARGQHSPAPGAPGSLAAATPSGTPTASLSLRAVSPGTTGPPGSRSSSTPASRRPSSPASTPSSTPPPTQTPGTLSESPASVALILAPGGGTASGSFTLTANGSGMTYSISVPAAYAGTLAVSPSSGSLASGASVTISVVWNSSAALSTGLTVEPGGQAVSVSYQPPAASPGP